MSGIERIDSVLSLVDINKINTPQYNVSIKKFDLIADVYRRLIFFVSLFTFNTSKDEKEKDAAYNIINKIAEDPECYSYDVVNKKALALTNEACDETRKQYQNLYVYSHWNETQERELRTAGRKHKADIVKNRLKEMLEMIASCKTYPERFLDKALSEGRFEEQIDKMKALQASIREKVQENISEQTANLNEENVSVPETKETAELTKPKKKRFWERLFN